MLSGVSKDKIAYFIGFMAGDGAFHNGRGCRKDRMAVSTTDEQVADWISEHIEFFDKTYTVIGNNKKAGIFGTLESYRKTFNVKYSGLFNFYGILCKKENRSLVNISKSNMREYLLGLFDADGSLSYSQRKDRDRISGKVSFTHPSVKLLSSVQKFLIDELHIPSSIKPKGDEKCFVLAFSNLDDINKFCEFLYGGWHVLDRKFNKFIQFSNELKSRRENGTSFPKEFMCSKEYGEIVGSYSKSMWYVDGVWYVSSSIASTHTGLDKRTITSRCEQRCKGCLKRPKTQAEIDDQKKQIKKQILAAYKTWSEVNI